MSVLMRRENTLIIEPGSDISKIQIINFILLPNSKKHFEGPPLQQLIIQLASYTLLIQKAFKAHQDAVENATIGVSINSAKNQRQLQDSRSELLDIGGGVLPAQHIQFLQDVHGPLPAVFPD
ncbi:Hypothetical_protein [Hexamita inflata]|uniref:Hypothetical_protein n=1 Tax=Hexamita inflata TaxID=28002 RepID=A0AA86QDN9_9EUKA|nr:Hypothetical protein HINF_LOCUS40643 [Hexamita inflata]